MEELSALHILFKKYSKYYEFHEDFIHEFDKAIRNTGDRKKLMKKLLNKLDAIQELDNIDCGLSWLEQLKHYDNMYSLHIKLSTRNYRILFSKENDKKYFLRMFDEKSGKNKTSYDNNVKIALDRKRNSGGDLYENEFTRNV